MANVKILDLPYDDTPGSDAAIEVTVDPDGTPASRHTRVSDLPIDAGQISGVLDDANIPAEITRDADLAAVATSGDYDDLTNKPTLGTAAAADTGDFATAAQGSAADTAVQPGDLGAVATSNDYDDLDNLPTLGTAAAADTGDFATAAQGALADTAVQPSDLHAVATSGDYDDLDNKPTLGTAAAANTTDFAAANHSHSNATTSTAGFMAATDKQKLDGIETGAEVNTVDSVNGQTGAVVLDPDDLDDTSTSHKFASSAELSKLAGIEAGADVTDATNVAAAGAVMKSQFSASDSFLRPGNAAIEETFVGEGRIVGRAVGSGLAALDAAQVRTIINVENGAQVNAVTSVNGQSGAVSLDADDISDSGTTNKWMTTAEKSKLSGIETGADVTDTTNVDAAGAVMNTDTSTASMSFVIDEDSMATNSATRVPTQQSVKAYVDSVAAGKITAFADPNADRIVFWDDSAGAFAALTVGTGLSISTTTLAAATASDTVAGVVELATTAETQTGTDATRAVTPDGLNDMTTLVGKAWFLDEDAMTSNDATKVASQQSIKAYVDTAVAGRIAAFADPGADRIVFWDDSAGQFVALSVTSPLAISGTALSVSAASDVASGIVELATTAETQTGTDTTRAVTPAAGAAAYHRRQLNVVTQSGTTEAPSLTEGESIGVATNSSGLTVTLPSNGTTAFPIGTTLSYVQMDADSPVIMVAGSSATVRFPGGKDRTAEQYAIITAIKIGTSEWVVGGNITTP